jgi:hypothetical protein
VQRKIIRPASRHFALDFVFNNPCAGLKKARKIGGSAYAELMLPGR